MLRNVDWQYVNNVSVQPIHPTFKGQRRHLGSSAAWRLKMGRIICTETSVIKYQSTLRNIPEERISRLHQGWSMKSQIPIYFCRTYRRKHQEQTVFCNREICKWWSFSKQSEDDYLLIQINHQLFTKPNRISRRFTSTK